MQKLCRMPALVFLFIWIASPVFSKVSWVHKFDDALKQAQAEGEGKLIVVDISASWCPPCQEMARKVYPDVEFINFSHGQIYMLLDAETDSEEARLSGKFDVHNYPTILVLNAKGQEIDRLIGGRDTKSLIRDLRGIFENPQPYPELVKQAKENAGDYGLQFRAGERALDRHDYSQARLLLGRAAGKSNKDADTQTGALLLLAMACYKDGKYTEA